MLIKAQKEITKISENEDINSQNYLESLNYISNLYLFINKLKGIISTEDVKFLPSFYGMNTSLKMNLNLSGKETEMKILKLSSSLFLVDNTAKQIKKTFEKMCENIIQDGEIITFILN